MELLNLLALAFGAGVASHIGIFIRGEWHIRAPKLVIIYLLVFVTGSAFEYRLHRAPYPKRWIVCGAVGYITGLFASITVYRSFFHGLRNFPGPKLARISKFWHVYQCWDSKNHLFLDRLHENYGNFVRIGPNELAIYHADAFQLTEGYGTRCTKPDFDDIMYPDYSLVFTRNKRVHDARRNVWSRATSQKSIASYQPRIQRQIEVLSKVVALASDEKKAVYINDLMYFYAFDSMGEFAFNQDFGMMRSQRWHAAADMFRRALSIVGPLSGVIWLIRIGFYFFSWFWRIADWFNMLRFCEERLHERLKDKPIEPDIAAHFIEQAEKEGWTDEAWKWLRGDSATVVVAGSNTTAPSLTFLLYAIAKYPEHQEKIFEEVVNVDPYDLSAISAMPHLNATINESMRMWPAATTIVVRQTPAEGLKIGDTLIPGHVKLIAPRWTIFKLESAFGKSKDFIPERWYSEPHLVKKKHAFAPFGAGRTACVGQGIAMTQLRMVVAKLVKEFHVRFAEDKGEDRIITAMKDQLTAKPGPLDLVFEKRVE